MVHKFYVYDSYVGTAKEVSLQYPSEDSSVFKSALDDFEQSLSLLLSGYRYLFIKPFDKDSDEDLGYHNIVVDGDSYLGSCLVDYVVVFFRLRGFIG